MLEVLQHTSKPFRTVNNLIGLNDDVLLCVISFLMTSSFRGKKRAAALFPLASTCRRLRELCSPFLFKNITWPGNAAPNPLQSIQQIDSGEYSAVLIMTYEEIPLSILPYIRCLRIRCSTSFSAIDLIPALEEMSSLVHCIFDCKHEPPSALLRAVAQRPSLTHLEFVQTPLTFSYEHIPLVGLHRLSLIPATGFIRINGGVKINGVDVLGGSDSGFISPGHGPLIRKNIGTIESLNIHYDLLPWEYLHDMTWPCLRTLIIMGDTPPERHTPVIAMLQGMQSLRNLQFQWSLRDSTQRTCLVPKAFKRYIDAASLAAQFPALSSLTLSNPSERDHIFSMLPPSVQYLHLPIITQGDNIGTSLSWPQLSTIFQSLAISKPIILGLKFTLPNNNITPDLLHTLAEKFPHLRYLEIDALIYRCQLESSGYVRSLLVDRLKPLTFQKWQKDSCRLSLHRFQALENTEEAEVAQDLAKNLPTLQSISFQSEVSVEPVDFPWPYPGVHPNVWNIT